MWPGAEGTAGRGDYNASLAYGKLLPGGKEQKLTGMTLDEIDRLQTSMLRHPANQWNSSAIGRYQIVRQTLRGLRRNLRLSGDQLYDEQLQDRLGAELARATRGRPDKLANEWASLRGRRLAEAVELMSRIDPNAPGARGYAKERPGDQMMGRAFGPGGVAAGAPKMEATGAVNIHLSGGLEKAPARVSMEGLFRDVKVNRGSQMSAAGE